MRSLRSHRKIPVGKRCLTTMTTSPDLDCLDIKIHTCVMSFQHEKPINSYLSLQFLRCGTFTPGDARSERCSDREPTGKSPQSRERGAAVSRGWALLGSFPWPPRRGLWPTSPCRPSRWTRTDLHLCAGHLLPKQKRSASVLRFYTNFPKQQLFFHSF